MNQHLFESKQKIVKNKNGDLWGFHKHFDRIANESLCRIGIFKETQMIHSHSSQRKNKSIKRSYQFWSLKVTTSMRMNTKMKSWVSIISFMIYQLIHHLSWFNMPHWQRNNKPFTCLPYFKKKIISSAISE